MTKYTRKFATINAERWGDIKDKNPDGVSFQGTMYLPDDDELYILYLPSGEVYDVVLKEFLDEEYEKTTCTKSNGAELKEIMGQFPDKPIFIGGWFDNFGKIVESPIYINNLDDRIVLTTEVVSQGDFN